MARILVAEDAQYVQYQFGKILKKEGHQVESSREGMETLQKIHSDPIELLILDLNLPGIEGIQVIKKAHESWPKLPFIVVCGDVKPETEEQLLKLGAASILKKPVSNEDLINSVDNVLHPARRIVFIPNQTESHEDFIKKLQDLGYSPETESRFAIIEKRIQHRDYHALVIWDSGSDPTFTAAATNLCLLLRSQGIWTPILVSENMYSERYKSMDIFPVAGNKPGTDRLFTRLSDLIGLQRKVVMGAVCIIQLAGHIDRDDVFSDTIQGMIAKRKNILINFRQVKYMGPYIRKVLDGLIEKAADLHLKVGLVAGPCLSEADMQSWTNQPMTPFQVFQDEKTALKTLKGGVR